MRKERTARYTISEVIMETLLVIVLVVVLSKVLLKALCPYQNKALDDKLKQYWKNLKNYFEK
jgi:hypothetical protein